ncbi:aminotransferase class III-fold pyridoxal phosphate-dependent enzyme [Silvanigrella sp.]|jgi:dethiobiotin synthetase/adenosylmethionine--8-amino-7-oxononanoate aminotransferase|uniref:aminotransferase class III-fold pyridoxal phosphate-dependent enzyme n=1 Tax=Silvanigrella sp. TaxID=2024976 RepID=UPI0037CCABA1
MLTKFPSYYVMASNTDLGKTVFSTGISMAAVRNGLKLLYIKPVQTGFPFDSDSSFVKNYNPSEFVLTKTIFSMSNPVSPHRAILQNKYQEESETKEHFLDDKMISIIEEEITTNDAQFVLIEGSGGVASPTLQGQLQCDVFRELRLPVIFIADSKLGGISCTISSIALIESRGFDITCILMFDGKDENALFLQKYYKNKFPVYSFQNIVESNLPKNETLIKNSLDFWFKDNEEKFSEVFQHLTSYHVSKIQIIDDYIEVAKENIWWPFTQHGLQIEPRVIDSAFKDNLTFVDIKNLRNQNILTHKSFDASASWWTQGIGHASPRLSHAAASAAGKYGHVMFPGNIHEPVVKLTQKLIATVGKGWAQRAFFSDNGSTAIEVALKIAFRKSFGLPQKETNMPKKDIYILGLKDSYHGDTHAAMDATNPNSYKKTDYWYEPKGYWFDYPTVYLKDRKQFVSIPESFNSNQKFELNINSIDEVFSLDRNSSDLANIYLNYIQNQMFILEGSDFLIGALLLEPVIQGAGGMKFVDPLFQRILVKECRKRKIPIIFDEVFTGFWRLGKISASVLLDEKPDIACYAKLLTGGLMPLSVTLANKECFLSFLGDSISQALLHGHSYAANPVGCAVAVEAIEETCDSKNFNKELNCLDIPWDEEIVNEFSCLPNIEKVFTLGSIFAFELKDKNSDYTSTRSKIIVQQLKQMSLEVRPLGNIIYILSGFNTGAVELKNILKSVYDLVKNE